MIYSLVALMLLASQASAFKSSPSAFTSPSTILRASSNSDMFGGPSTPKVPEVAPKISPLSAEATTDSYKTQAAKLRQEAAEMEVALREEARAKGLPEEMINKLVPLRSPTQSSTAVLEAPAEVKLQTLTASEIRAKLGYLNSGDAVRFTSELDRIRAKGILRLWNSKDLSKLDASDFVVSNAQLKNKGKIEAVKLKLDDVGFKYQNVLVGAIVIGTVCGLSSSAIGGQLGFLLGYASALFPILLVGIGSIAPALIGDILNRISYLTNSEAKDRYITQNAAKFLVGYSVGLPVSRFGSDGFSNVPEFFQIRPNTEDKATKSRAMFSKGFSQKDIARCAITCLAPNVAECIIYGEASGTTAADVGLLYEVLNSVEPPLKPEDAQNMIRWAALTSYEVLSENQELLTKLSGLFREGAELETCIAAIEENDAKK